MEERTLSGVERRRFPRYPIDVPAKLVRASNGSKIYPCRATNMGLSGIQALVSIELQLQEHVVIEVTLPYDTQQLRLQAEVRNRSGHNYGLRFLPLDTAEEARIRRICGVLSLMFDFV